MSAETEPCRSTAEMPQGTLSAAIIVPGLQHWFGENEARKQAPTSIDTTIERDEFVVLLGPSGSGKTTLLTLVSCLRAVQEGHV